MYITTISGEWIFVISAIFWIDGQAFTHILHSSCALLVHHGPSNSDSKWCLKVIGPSSHSTHCRSYPAFGFDLMGCIVHLSGNLEARNIVWSIFAQYFPESERAESFDSLTIFDYLIYSYVWNLKLCIYCRSGSCILHFFFGHSSRRRSEPMPDTARFTCCTPAHLYGTNHCVFY